VAPEEDEQVRIGQLRLLRGVHPFYADMDFQSFCIALKGWEVEDVNVTVDEYIVEAKKKWDTSLSFVAKRNAYRVVLKFIGDPCRRVKFSDLVGIETDDAILPDGRALSQIDIREFEEVFSCKLTRNEIPDRQIEGLGHWSCADDLASMLVFEYEGLVTGIGVYRDPGAVNQSGV